MLISKCTAAMAAVLLLAACTTSDQGASTGGPAMTRDTAIGPVLTDTHGMTLYTLASDTDGKSSCDGRCTKSWPPFVATPGAKPMGKWSVTAREDGTQQWAYAGKPLYLWDKDKQPGDVTGHKVGDVWWAARP